jgi:LuxR family maltose regulon positive regulatory protein
MIDDPAIDSAERCECAAICGVAAYYADDLLALEQHFLPWAERINTLPPLLRAHIGNQNAGLLLYRGHADRARRYYRDEQPAEVADLAYIWGWAEWQIGFSYLWEGAAANAEESLRASLLRIEASTGRRSPIAVELAAALAAALWDRDQLDEAGTVLANRLDILEKRGIPEATIMGFTVAARVAAASGLERRAHDLLDSLFSLGELRHLPRLCICSLAEQIRMHALRHRKEACATLLARLASLSLDDARQHWGAIEALVDIQIGLAQAYAAISRNDWPQVLTLLARPGQLADERRRGRDALQIRLLRALAMRRCGEDGGSLLAEALDLAQIQGLERIIVDTHPDLVDWARTLRSSAQRTEAATIQTADLRALNPPARERTAAPRVNPSAILTPKERDILRLMADNLTNKQIGLAMGVSYQTIKWHLKNLFVKLNADTRRHALDQARMFGLLD